MVRKLEDLEKNPEEIEQVREWAMEVMQFMFSESQKNIVINMPWGDSDNPNMEGKKPSKISFDGWLLGSGRVPRWEDDKIVFEYTINYASDVEWGSPPKYIIPAKLEHWVNKKLNIKNPKAVKVVSKNISKKIARDGILPHPYLRPAINSAVRRYNLKIKPFAL